MKELWRMVPAVTWQAVILGLVLFAVTSAVSSAIVSWVLVKLPPTYFQAAHDRDFWKEKHRALRWGGIVGKNLAGVLLIALGVMMSLPGIPGPGFLTILLGVMLLDFPGKRALELKIVSRPRVLNGINGLRRKFDKPPLLLD